MVELSRGRSQIGQIGESLGTVVEKRAHNLWIGVESLLCARVFGEWATIVASVARETLT
jgi:hypothetical protein